MAESNPLEELADVQHEIWAHWMKYLFSVSVKNADGSVTIPAEKAENWERQISTNYHKLTENEKASDIEQAEKVVTRLKSMNIQIK